jgi:hypothetical protein
MLTPRKQRLDAGGPSSVHVQYLRSANLEAVPPGRGVGPQAKTFLVKSDGVELRRAGYPRLRSTYRWFPADPEQERNPTHFAGVRCESTPERRSGHLQPSESATFLRAHQRTELEGSVTRPGAEWVTIRPNQQSLHQNDHGGTRDPQVQFECLENRHSSLPPSPVSLRGADLLGWSGSRSSVFS